MPVNRLTRSSTEGQIAGVCAGLARYFNVDVVFVRAAWVVLSIVPGAVIGGVIAYLIAWAMIPESPDVLPLPPSRLRRSTADQQIAGVCGGLAEYFGVDSTVVRVLWVLLSIFGGAVVGGLIAYALAWLIIPRAPQLLAAPASGESA